MLNTVVDAQSPHRDKSHNQDAPELHVGLLLGLFCFTLGARRVSGADFGGGGKLVHLFGVSGANTFDFLAQSQRRGNGLSFVFGFAAKELSIHPIFHGTFHIP